MMKKLKSIITLCCLLIGNPLLHCTPATAAETEILDYIVAVVNNDVIVNSTLQQEFRRYNNELRKKNTRLPPREYLEKQVLEGLILTSLQLQLAKRTGIQVEDSRLNAQLRQIAAQTQMDLQSFRHQLEREGHNFVHIRENLRKEMIIRRLRQRYVVSRINVTDREIENFLANQVQQGTVNNEYHLWHILIATPKAPSPEEIEAKEQKAKEVLAKLKAGDDFKAMAVYVSDSRQAREGGDLGWLKAGEVPTLFNRVVNSMAVGDIGGYLRDASGFHIIKLVDKRGGDKTIITQTKARHILILTNELVSDFEAQNRLKELKYRIEQGDDFAELARAYSQDQSSTANGGSLGWRNPGDLDPEFEEVMVSLSENQVCEPFKSRYGWHIVQVLERREHDNTKQVLRTKAEEQIRKRKNDAELQTWLQQLREEAYVEIRAAPFR
jgi:peptidyl-prolyl cis-trans isomerase SurA